MLPSIRNRVRAYLYLASVVTIIVLLLLFSLVQVFIMRRQAADNADVMFEQVIQVLEENDKELLRTTAEFKESCLQNADTVAYMIDQNPDLVNTDHLDENVGNLRYIARLVGVSEINIFDDTGTLFIGTNPNNLGYTFDSGEQLRFFKPMLLNRSLRMYQDITPNTTESKPMQYSAVWSANYIVQVGVEPDAVNAVTRRNDPSYIFAMLNTNAGVSVYAVADNGLISGSTEEADIGLHCDEVGLPLSRLASGKNHFTVRLHGQTRAFCEVNKWPGGYIVYLESNRMLYRAVPY